MLVVLIAVFALGRGDASSFFHCKDKDLVEFSKIEDVENQEETIGFGLPLLEIPSVYQGQFGSKEYAVFVESSSETELKGHYLALDKEMSDSIAFHLFFDGENLHFVSHDIDICQKISELHSDGRKVEGVVQQSFLNQTHFSFSFYETQQFVEYDTIRYQQPQFEIQRSNGVHFANVVGYWSELDERTNSEIDMFLHLNQVLNEHNLDLYMDVYSPKNDTLAKRPFVMLIHGGAFYYGSRKDETVSRLCKHLASLGYVTASIDYRIGFQPTKDGIERSGYCAIQDTHAAMRFVTANQDAFGIDTSMMFIGGCSAGAITALGLAFMTNETRPLSTRESLFNTELGDIQSSGNGLDARFSLKGVVDMWGAMPDLALLEGKNIPIVAFHGDADNILPYGCDFPFGAIGNAKKLLFNKMYGSSCIVAREKELGVKSELYTFKGYKHSPQIAGRSAVRGEMNDNFYFVQDKMCAFLDEIIRENKPQVVKRNGWYQLDGEVYQCNWAAEGGLIVDNKCGDAKVVWIGNAPQCKLKVSGIQKYGVGFTQEVRVK